MRYIGFEIRISLGPKGRNIIAQVEGLGFECGSKQGLKGRVNSRYSCSDLSGLEIFSYVPEPSTRAKMTAPLRV